MKKGATFIGVILVLVMAGAYFYFVGKEYVFRFSESEIKSTLEKSLPLTKTYLFIIQVTLKNPRVQLENGSSRVNAGLDVVFNITVGQSKEPLGGSVDVSGGVRYVSEAGQFFLTEPNIENLQIQGVSDTYTDKVYEALSKAISEYYSENPIYTLNAFDAKQATVRMVLKNVIVENQELVITLGV
ncbi:MAG: hypothetical protein DRR42_22255 [Gammaproteobacteria bacterium]|nr:MAG: hypothetical protein DRR42_22255 [Gammaproteobacteria bacterium]